MVISGAGDIPTVLFHHPTEAINYRAHSIMLNGVRFGEIQSDLLRGADKYVALIV